MRRRLVAVAALALSIAACSAPAEVAQAPKAESAFVIVQNLDVITDWDPATSYSNEIIAHQNIYETLTVWNPVTKKASPRLATSWRSSGDGKVWMFTLRPGVTFHTGRPFDSAAVKSSIERTMKLGEGAAYIWDAVSDIKADDPLTVTFTLKYPVPLDLVASAGYAAYIYDTQAAADLSTWFKAGRDAGTGPYTVASWAKGKEEELTLTSYQDYWGGWERPHYGTVKYRVVPDEDRAWRLLLRGEVSFVDRLSPRLQAKAEANPGVRTSRRPSFQTAMLLFNTESGPMADLRVRRAVQKAIDYRGVIKALRGAAAPISGVIPEGLFGHVPDRAPKQDLAAATRLLERAGYGPAGRPLRLSLTYAEGDADQEVLATLLTETLKELNVTLEARAMPWLEQWDLGKKRGQDIFLMYWWPDYADGYSWFGNVFHSESPTVFNLAYLNDPATDKLLDTLPQLSVTDRAAAQRGFVRATTRVLDQKAAAALPWVVNYHRAFLGGVQGYDDNPAYPDVVFVYDLRPSG
ncbi:ABC transporter substrate-binding protein [Nonomuraea cavernae]|uniref:Glutathione ABC transporter substrate-binding protein n=1 Tax=Nonomuraea cavernae TaxID=2045107 RepID=A0A918DGL0_9ACTN|nr:ABC transporter substrate-binding protein [Nonomuraea cavernae]MCA2185238.1 ABC transporter substrate-binding protein [Nonomuraea cavernae]GGO65827.1 glutathione ABC transporter substrate-binding protein [Nonomuraea cavernae]